MCLMEEVMLVVMYKEILDSKIKELLFIELDQLLGRGFCYLKKVIGVVVEDVDLRVCDQGNDSVSIVFRSIEEFFLEDVFIELEFFFICEELFFLELRQEKLFDVLLEFVQIVSQMEVQFLIVMLEVVNVFDCISFNFGVLFYEIGLSGLEIVIKGGDKVIESF